MEAPLILSAPHYSQSVVTTSVIMHTKNLRRGFTLIIMTWNRPFLYVHKESPNQ